MATDLKQYLLYYPSQIEAFRKNHAAELKNNAAAYRRWILSLPLMEWVPLILTPGAEEVSIGIICVLYVDGYINISFHASMTKIVRCPMSEEEMTKWMKETGWHGPGIDNQK